METFLSIKKYYCFELKIEKIIYLWSFFVKYEDFGQFGTINTRLTRKRRLNPS